MTLVRESDLLVRFRDDANPLLLRSGSITVLFGRNGAGKTYWLESMAGLHPGTGAEVRYGSLPLWKEGRRGRKARNPDALKAYAYSSQAPEEQLVGRTVEEELLETLKPYSLSSDERRRRMLAALEAVGWEESWLVRSPYRLSGGERRRLALACLLVAPSDWLLLDEPTAGLDAPGQEQLRQILAERAAREGQGVLLISHDTEWALPLADQVLLLAADGGSLRECSPEELLHHPDWWEEAGMAVPAWLKVLEPMLRTGIPISSVWKPSELARQWGRLVREAGESPPESSVVYRMDNASARQERQKGSRSSIAFFDPRALWLSYVLLSVAILAQQSWWGVAAGGAIAAAAIWGGRIPIGRWRGFILSFLVFTLTVSVVAGIGRDAGGQWGFQGEAFLTALHSMARTFIVFLLGLGLAVSITPIRLRRSLESVLGFRGRIAPAFQKFLLTVTLMLRFIPIFLNEWERFNRYAIARGKEAGRKSLGGSVRRLSRTAQPFLLSLFRLGDQAAVALESRGVGRQKYPTLLKLSSWGKRDTALVAVVLLLSLVLWLVRGLGA
ncbi:ATP-binding cassette domain-containing protein [Cohnella thailandensis]|uniref:ATP-binding cassette domain-containing protein n=1 Tax=Cohnella thailandensis TaxID=557557 RepID=A0A841T2I3_9BACL|nr:ATP-binding cassette domain-containing protein [Cohnella thailandensis]MBB6635301.1 ATP-binding cassette domain-containing protein [Cohnella thailandensis]MBP1974680.1 energy-coupling factor transport system ATP-binding protein [Cohnella thailandensis]